MSKKKVSSRSAIPLKDFHGGQIPSDMSLPSAPGITVERTPTYDRLVFNTGNGAVRGSFGMGGGGAEFSRQGPFNGGGRGFSEVGSKAVPFPNSATIGRNYEEDERGKPGDSDMPISRPRSGDHPRSGDRSWGGERLADLDHNERPDFRPEEPQAYRPPSGGSQQAVRPASGGSSTSSAHASPRYGLGRYADEDLGPSPPKVSSQQGPWGGGQAVQGLSASGPTAASSGNSWRARGEKEVDRWSASPPKANYYDPRAPLRGPVHSHLVSTSQWTSTEPESAPVGQASDMERGGKEPLHSELVSQGQAPDYRYKELGPVRGRGEGRGWREAEPEEGPPRAESWGREQDLEQRPPSRPMEIPSVHGREEQQRIHSVLASGEAPNSVSGFSSASLLARFGSGGTVPGTSLDRPGPGKWNTANGSHTRPGSASSPEEFRSSLVKPTPVETQRDVPRSVLWTAPPASSTGIGNSPGRVPSTNRGALGPGIPPASGPYSQGTGLGDQAWQAPTGSALVQSPRGADRAAVGPGATSLGLSENSDRPKLNLQPRSQPGSDAEGGRLSTRPRFEVNDREWRGGDRSGQEEGRHAPTVDAPREESPEPSHLNATTAETVSERPVERPKLKLMPRSGAVEKAAAEEGARSLFGGARPREEILKDRGVDDAVIKGIEDLPPPESAPTAAASPPAPPTPPAEQRRGDSTLKKALGGQGTRPPGNQTVCRTDGQRGDHHAEGAADRDDNWRRPAKQEGAPGNSSLVHSLSIADESSSSSKYTTPPSALELARAFSRSTSLNSGMASSLKGPPSLLGRASSIDLVSPGGGRSALVGPQPGFSNHGPRGSGLYSPREAPTNKFSRLASGLS